MTLKEELEAIWKRHGVINPSNINWWIWFDPNRNSAKLINNQICCLKGRRGPRLGPKPKGPGCSISNTGRKRRL